MKRVSDSLFVTIERFIFGRLQSVPLLNREEFQLLPTSSDETSSSCFLDEKVTIDRDPITLEEFTDETVRIFFLLIPTFMIIFSNSTLFLSLSLYIYI